MSLFSRIADAGRSVASALVGGAAYSGSAEAARPPPTKEIAIPAPYHARDAHILGAKLTPERLTAIIYQRKQGYLQEWMDLAHESRSKNPHLHSQLAIREQSVVETEVAVTPGPGSNGQAAAKCSRACNELLDRWREGEFERWLAEWVSCNYTPLGCHEVMWDRGGGETSPESLAWVLPRRLSYACDPGDPSPWRVRLWDQDGMGPFARMWGYPLDDFHPDKFLVTAPRVTGDIPTCEGLFAVVVWWQLFYVWDWRDLLALIEMLGRPPVVGYYAAGGAQADGALKKFNGDQVATPEQVNAVKRAVQMVSGSLRAVLADTTKLEGVQLPLTGEHPIQIATAEAIEKLMSKAINGVSTSSDLQPGSRAAQESMERTSLTFWRSDCRMAARNMRRLFAMYLRANPTRFPNPVTPTVKFRTDDPEYLTMTKRVKDALDVGLQVPRAWAHEVTGIPEPTVSKKDGTTEPVLERAPTPAPTAQPERQGPPVQTPGAPATTTPASAQE